MDKEKIQIKIDNINSKINKNKSLPYYILSVFCIVIPLFFLSSNIIFNKEIKLYSTEINKEIHFSSLSVALKNREFNPESGLIKFTIKIKNNSINFNKNLDFELREKSNPTKLLNKEIIKVNDTDYIIMSNLNSKWEAISINIIDKNNNSNVKLYSDIKDITINNNLKKSSDNEYKIEIINNEINDIQKEIQNINTDISNKNNTINSLKDIINKLELEKQYQTESEIEATNNIISSHNSTITQLENEIEFLNKNVAEYEEKIQKLKEKIQNLN